MAKENFNWKGLFVNEEKEDGAEEQSTNSFPANSSPGNYTAPKNYAAENVDKFPVSTASPIMADNTPVTSNKFLPEILATYEKGFNSLNNEGFDFFELYKSVCAVGVDNPQSYQMAFAMGQSLRPDLSKAFLLEKSSYYIGEIEKVHSNYDSIGKARESELNNTINQKKKNLTTEVLDLQKQIAALQTSLQAKSAELAKIDSDVTEPFDDIKLKIAANDEAKQKILATINTVVAGIKQYL